MSTDPPPPIVVVTGGTAGVGRATVRRFVSAGYSVAVLARGADGLRATVAEVEAHGGAALGLSVDVADAAAVEAAADRVEAELGPIDVWINNAMTTVFGRFLDIQPDEYRRVTDVTYHGAVNGTRAALARMLPRNRGVIIQVSSALAFRAIPLQSAYCGAKHGIRAMTEGVRAELIHDGGDIHIGMVHLPGLNTPQFGWCRSKMDREAQPVPPIFQPEIAADAIFVAASRRRRDVYVGFPTFETIAGEELAPGLMDRVLARKAFDGQLLPEPRDRDRPDNLFEPVAGDHGAHGRFNRRARRRDRFTEIAEHLGGGTHAVSVALAGGALLLLGAWMARRIRR